MLSEGKKLTRPDYLKALPPIERPITVRLRFVKLGKLQYISHLDLQRTFNRILVRSGLPVWYTKGFNPHAKLVFSTPLSVGTQSICEFLDIKMDREMPCDEIMRILNAEMTEEMHITKAYIPKTKFSDIAYCAYEYEIHSAGVSQSTCDAVSTLFSTSPLSLVKRTKSGEREVDIVPLIRSVESEYDLLSDKLIMRAVLNAETESFLNPEMLITALKGRLGLLCGDPSEEWYSIVRTVSFDSKLEEFR